MTTGYSILRYPQQVEPEYNLQLENSYYLVRLYQAHAFFKASFFTRSPFITINIMVESPYQPGQVLNSIYGMETFDKNRPYNMPISANLTTYLPTKSNDTLRIKIRFIVTRDNPFQKLTEKIQEANLVAVISAASLEWGAAVKVSEITGHLLSFLLKEGKEETIFEMDYPLNISELKAGYHLIIRPPENSAEPKLLEIDKNHQLRGDETISRSNYLLFKVLTIPRLGEETARGRPWWELLQTCKDKTKSGLYGTSSQKNAALRDWNNTLIHVKELARHDSSFLLSEIQQIIGRAQKEIDECLKIEVEPESHGITDYPNAWQDILGVENEVELEELLRDYQNATELTTRLIRAYEEKVD